MRWHHLLIFAISCIGCKQNSRKVDWAYLADKYQNSDPIFLKSLEFLSENVSGRTSELPALINPNTGELYSLKKLQSDGVDSTRLGELINSKGYRVSTSYKAEEDILSTGQVEGYINNVVGVLNKSVWKNDIPEDVYYNYLLPYKISGELPSDLTKILANKEDIPFKAWQNKVGFRYQDRKTAYIDSIVNGYIIPVHKYFYRYGEIVNIGSAPSYEELKLKQRGDCNYEAFIETYLLRAKGIPAAFDFIPAWGSANGSHAFTSYWNTGEQKMRLLIGFKYSPAKIYRRMFKRQGVWSKQIAPLVSEGQFPMSFLKDDFVKDVTDEHVPTSSLRLPIRDDKESKLAYLCVLNYGKWQPITWGRITDKNVVFEKVGRNVLYRMAIPTADFDLEYGDPFLLDSAGKMEHLETYREKVALALHGINSGTDSYVRKNRQYVLSSFAKNGEVLPLRIINCTQDSILKFKEITKAKIYRLAPINSNRLARPFLYENGKQIWL